MTFTLPPMPKGLEIAACVSEGFCPLCLRALTTNIPRSNFPKNQPAHQHARGYCTGCDADWKLGVNSESISYYGATFQVAELQKSPRPGVYGRTDK